MKLRELINKLEELSENGKNDNLRVVLSQPALCIAGGIENVYTDGTISGNKYVSLVIQ